ncbi:MAG: M20/M25/M40 family metallo-hydrolase [Lentisphaeria bacterium]|nr:M20/M25/M40 family metallo-hydrolase [Lentisphaeria bacterium]
MSTEEKITEYIRSVQEEVQQLIRDLCAVPAPSNHEELRAEFCRNWFVENGFENVSVDPALNVQAPVNVTADNDLVVVMAHTDTVFPDTEKLPFSEDDKFMYSPGVTDDTANLAVMMVCARFFRENFPGGNEGFLFVANSGEEGLGNLKGCRRIMADYQGRVKKFITIDGFSPRRVVDRAVGSHRYRITVRTEGGHSFANFGNRNAIAVLAAMIGLLYTVKVPQNGNSRTTYNAGVISGGTSVNTIAQQAEMLYEYRSDDESCLEKMRLFLEQVVSTFRASGVAVEKEIIGDRPCSGRIDEARFSAFREKIHASVRKVTGLEPQPGTSSTDANIPLSLGIPAVCISACCGSGAHTREEKLEKASLADGCRLLLDILFSLGGPVRKEVKA